MMFVYMFLAGTMIVPAYSMIVPQVVMIILMLNFYWSTRYREGEAPSLRKHLMLKLRKARKYFFK